jgi:hypothetical protein
VNEIDKGETTLIAIMVCLLFSGLLGTISPLPGGLMAAHFGYMSVFIVSISFLIVGGAVVRIYVAEPRKRVRHV